MSPILVRPVREQLEHDRIIRQLHAKFRRRYDAGMNPGNEQNAAVGAGPTALYPDLVLSSPERGHRVQVVVEVETGESVNHLEALAQWAHFAKLRAAFHLYVPAGMVDVARRLCEDNHIHVAEVWSYHTVGDEVRFTVVQRSREAAPVVRAPRPPATRPAAARPPAARPAAARPAAARPSATRSAGARPAARKAAGAKRASRPSKATKKVKR